MAPKGGTWLAEGMWCGADGQGKERGLPCGRSIRLVGVATIRDAGRGVVCCGRGYVVGAWLGGRKLWGPLAWLVQFKA